MLHQSGLEISNEQKVAIILKLLDSSRSQIMTWHNQAYVATTASLGLILIVANFWLRTPKKTLAGLVACELGIAAFAILTQIYLWATQYNYQGNEDHKVRCQYALRLAEENAYLVGERFYWAAEKKELERGMPARDIPPLKWSHAITSFLLATVSAMSFLGFMP